MSMPGAVVPSSSTPQQVGAGWARERLRLGMSNVGFWVVIAAGVVVLGAPVPGLGAVDGLVLLAGYLAIQAGFDLIGGWWLQQRHGRGARPLGAFLAAWARGVAVQSVLFAGAGAAALALFDLGGSLAVLAGAALGMVMLLGLQGPMIWLTTGLRTRPLSDAQGELARRAGLDPRGVKLVDAADASFVGGWVGLPGTETLVVPASWSRALSDDAWVAQLQRRAVARSTGQRLRGVGLALLWNLVGLGAALLVFGAADLDGLVRVIAAFTLWSFVAVLALPTASRRGVYAVDAATVAQGADPAALRAALRALDTLQDDEPARSEVVESIFHPVPALSRRLDALQAPDPPSGGAWHAARMSLLLGQVVASPLSRAVHCNIGRPELWAAYPGD